MHPELTGNWSRHSHVYTSISEEMLPQPCLKECIKCRGVTSLAYEADAGASGLLYSVGADGSVCALDAASGAQVVKFKAGSHPLSCVGAAPGQSTTLLFC